MGRLLTQSIITAVACAASPTASSQDFVDELRQLGLHFRNALSATRGMIPHEIKAQRVSDQYVETMTSLAEARSLRKLASMLDSRVFSDFDIALEHYDDDLVFDEEEEIDDEERLSDEPTSEPPDLPLLIELSLLNDYTDPFKLRSNLPAHLRSVSEARNDDLEPSNRLSDDSDESFDESPSYSDASLSWDELDMILSSAVSKPATAGVGEDALPEQTSAPVGPMAVEVAPDTTKPRSDSIRAESAEASDIPEHIVVTPTATTMQTEQPATASATASGIMYAIDLDEEAHEQEAEDIVTELPVFSKSRKFVPVTIDEEPKLQTKPKFKKPKKPVTGPAGFSVPAFSLQRQSYGPEQYEATLMKDLFELSKQSMELQSVSASANKEFDGILNDMEHVIASMVEEIFLIEKVEELDDEELSQILRQRDDDRLLDEPRLTQDEPREEESSSASDSVEGKASLSDADPAIPSVSATFDKLFPQELADREYSHLFQSPQSVISGCIAARHEICSNMMAVAARSGYNGTIGELRFRHRGLAAEQSGVRDAQGDDDLSNSFKVAVMRLGLALEQLKAQKAKWSVSMIEFQTHLTCFQASKFFGEIVQKFSDRVTDERLAAASRASQKASALRTGAAITAVQLVEFDYDEIGIPAIPADVKNMDELFKGIDFKYLSDSLKERKMHFHLLQMSYDILFRRIRDVLVIGRHTFPKTNFDLDAVD